MLTKEFDGSYFLAVIEIAESLPEWFTSTGLELMKEDFFFQSPLGLFDENVLIGFLTFIVNQGSATITWMGVSPNFHKKGLGRSLIFQLEAVLQNRGVIEIFVSTLGDSVDYEPYNRTKVFYRRCAFADHRILKHPDNPGYAEELVLRKRII